MVFVHVAHGQQEQAHLGRQAIGDVVLNVQLLKGDLAAVVFRDDGVLHLQLGRKTCALVEFVAKAQDGATRCGLRACDVVFGSREVQLTIAKEAHRVGGGFRGVGVLGDKLAGFSIGLALWLNGCCSHRRGC